MAQSRLAYYKNKIEKRFVKFISQYTYRLSDEGDYKFGYNNLKWFAKRYNTLNHALSHSRRQSLYEKKMENLLNENPNYTPNNIRIEESWAIDKSMNFPLLQEFIDAAKNILNRTDFKKRINPAFDIVSTPDDLIKYPVLLDFATSSTMLSIVADYLKCIPVLTNIEVLESSPVEGENSGLKASQLFHKDQMDSRMIRVTIHIEDVNEENGPFTFLPKSVSDEASRKLNYGSRNQTYRIKDNEMYSVVDEKKLIKATGPSGTVLFVDASNCFHYGSRTIHSRRRVAMLTYETDVPEHFREILTNGTNSNFKRFIKDSDSQLRKLVLNPHLYLS